VLTALNFDQKQPTSSGSKLAEVSEPNYEWGDVACSDVAASMEQRSRNPDVRSNQIVIWTIDNEGKPIPNNTKGEKLLMV
jgi:hypothetical protein